VHPLHDMSAGCMGDGPVQLHPEPGVRHVL
jgi:hypothetical protein